MTSDTSKTTTTQTHQRGDLVLWITYLNIVLYALSYQLQTPVEPFLIQSLTAKEAGDADSVNKTYGNLQSFFSFCQMFGSPLVGILLDRIGIRKTSAVVFVASALSYAILASASDLTMLFVSKIPTIFQAAFLVAQATAATSTAGDSAMRAAALGRMTTAYTIGATIGPALGGYLAGQGDFYIGAKLAVAGSLVSAVLSLLFLPDGKGGETEGKGETQYSPPPHKENRSFVQELRRTGEIVSRPTLWPLLMVKVLGGVGASMHSTALPLVLTQKLGFEPSQLGLSMSGAMFSVAAFGAFAMAPLMNSLGSFGMMNAGLIVRSGLGLLMAMIVSISTDNSETTMMEIVAVSILYALSQHVLATGLTTQTTGNVDKDEQGSLLGMEHSLFSLARIGGPAIGTFLLGSGGGGLWQVEMACGSLDLLLAASLAVTLPQSSKSKDS
jgi:predicted MFS family arabinose efflux permease